MAEFGDSLVIRLLADASGVLSELDQVLGRFESLQTAADRFAQTQQQFSRWGASISAATGPLQSLGRLLDQVTQQAENLGRTTISLNVGPALNALSTLSSAISSTAAQLQALSVPVGLPSGGGFPFAGGGPSSGILPRFATGGFVHGPGGVDRVPAWLTAGEFVLNANAVQHWGVGFLQELNQGTTRAAPAAAWSAEGTGSSSVTNQFGGVTIQVQSAVELDSLVSQMQHAAARQRVRWG